MIYFFWKKKFFPQMSKKVLAVNFLHVNYNEKNWKNFEIEIV